MFAKVLEKRIQKEKERGWEEESKRERTFLLPVFFFFFRLLSSP
jgi:hypothetical protein